MGLLLALSYPKPGWSGLAWIAPGLLLTVTAGLPRGGTFRTAYIAGLTHYLVSLGWLLHIPFPPGAIAGWLSLSAYCAVFPAAWTLLVWHGLPAAFPSNPTPDNASIPVPDLPGSNIRFLDRCQTMPWISRTTVLLSVAAAWVLGEMILGRFLSGFPWNFLGISQYRNVPLIQISSFTGIYGLSFLVCWVSVSGALVVHRLCQALGGRRPLPSLLHDRPSNLPLEWAADLRLPLFTLLAVTGWGLHSITVPSSPDTRYITLALIQPSIPQTLIWDDMGSTNRFEQIYALSEKALIGKPTVLIWPENSLPSIGRDQFDRMLALTASAGCYWIFGSDDLEILPDATNAYNSAFLFNPSGRFAATYRKQQLVMFGETIPLEHWLPFMKWLTPVSGSLTPGKAPVPFQLGSNGPVASPLICFEDNFPHHTRKYATADVDFLLELTNDGWFGESSAQWQHAASTAFRAVENGVPLVRVANNGLTGWIDEHGRFREILGLESGNVYQPGFLTVSLPLPPRTPPRATTFYTKYGDLFGWICAGGWGVLGVRIGIGSRLRTPLNSEGQPS